MILENTQTEERFVSYELMNMHKSLFKMVRLGLMKVEEAENILNRIGLVRVDGKIWTDTENSSYTLSE
jgi:hypothetical protein